MGIKLYDFGDKIVYECTICYTDLIWKEHGYAGITNSCPHYDAYTLSPSQKDECPEDKLEVELKDYDGWRYIICRNS